MNHTLIIADQIFKSGMIAFTALLQPFLFRVQFDHVALLLVKTIGRDKSFELFSDESALRRPIDDFWSQPLMAQPVPRDTSRPARIRFLANRFIDGSGRL